MRPRDEAGRRHDALRHGGFKLTLEKYYAQNDDPRLVEEDRLESTRECGTVTNMSDTSRYKTVSISPKHHRRLERLAAKRKPKTTLGGFVEWLIDQHKPPQGETAGSETKARRS